MSCIMKNGHVKYVGKNFIPLEADIICECKNISSAIISAPIIHNHDGYELFLMLDGQALLYTEGDGKILERGDLICIKAHAFHHVKLLEHNIYDRIVINFGERVLKKISSEKSDLGRCFNTTSLGELTFVHLNEEDIQELVSYAELLERSLKDNRFGADLLSSSLLVQILVMVNRRMAVHPLTEYIGKMPKLVSDTFAYIDQHLSEELTLDVLEKHFQYNGTYISRCFKKVAGIPLQQYIIAKRITLAQQYLQQGIKPCDACYMSGFNNYSNFSRTFLQNVGIPPKKYQVIKYGNETPKS